ncbi:MAG TPA: MFS transporter [Acetobacteraceae bacterium]|jgi:MFS family permease
METSRSRIGLNGLNFFSAAVQTGFGPYVAVWLIQQGWSQTDVGVALSIGTLAGLIGQLPGGWLVDAVQWKRHVTSAALAAIGLSALILAWLPYRDPVWVAEAVHGLASCIITPAIAAITLRLCGHAAYSERLGMNGRYASLGTAVTAGLLGLCAWALPAQSVFIVTALLVVPALLALFAIRKEDCAEGEEHVATLPLTERRRRGRPWQIFRQPALHAFAACAVLFHVSNAAMLTIALNALAEHVSDTAAVVSAAILIPQLVAAALSPYVGTLAQRLGRRPVLIAGFAALPVRGVLFALLFAIRPSTIPLLVCQVLDGLSATVFGLMVPLIAADLTRRTGHLNLAIGTIGLAVGIGATISTTLAGWLADAVGVPNTLLALAAVGGAATLLVRLAMPETHPGELPRAKTPAMAR